MELNLSKDLLDLAKIFAKNDAKLYIVGGFVRNAIMGFCETDIDVCSRLKPDEIEKILDKRKYSVTLVNPKLGTVHIRVKSTDLEYEHTTFRAEDYARGGKHSPTSVRFVDDIPLDASRRDFSANAIYYDVLSGEIIDYYNGVADIKCRALKTVETPEYVFACDGLRILRLIRIASELNFEIEQHTFDVAKKMVAQLEDISQERFNKEIVSVLFADYKYDAIVHPTAHIWGLEKFSELGAWEYVLPKFTQIVGKNEVRKLYNSEWLNLIKSAQPALRISAFVVDICSYLKIEPSSSIIYAILGTGGVMLNKKECERQFKILSAYTKVKHGEIYSEEHGRIFLQKIDKYSSEILALCDLANLGGRLHQISKLMQLDKVPFNLKQLDINGRDISETYPEIEKQYYSQILNKLLNRCAIMPELNRKDLLILEANNIYREIKKG